MKTNRIFLTIVSILTIFAMVACGATGPKPIETPAKDINFAVTDLGEGYSMLQETDDISSMGLSSSDPVNSASMRAFTTDKMDMVVSVVMNAKTAKDAEDAFGDKGLVSTISTELKGQIPGAEFKEISGLTVGEKTVAFGAEGSMLGNVYMLVFKKVNIVCVVFIAGQSLDQAGAVEVAKKLEAKIK